MLYYPANNLPFPCDAEKKPKRSHVARETVLHSGNKLKLIKRNSYMSSIVTKGDVTKKEKTLEKRADGDPIPIKLQPCPFPNGAQEHRWAKSTSSRLKW